MRECRYDMACSTMAVQQAVQGHQQVWCMFHKNSALKAPLLLDSRFRCPCTFQCCICSTMASYHSYSTPSHPIPLLLCPLFFSSLLLSPPSLLSLWTTCSRERKRALRRRTWKALEAVTRRENGGRGGGDRGGRVEERRAGGAWCMTRQVMQDDRSRARERLAKTNQSALVSATCCLLPPLTHTTLLSQGALRSAPASLSACPSGTLPSLFLLPSHLVSGST